MYYSQPGIIIATDPLINILGTYYGLVANTGPGDTVSAQRNTLVLRGLIELANASCDNTSGATYGTTIVFPGHTDVFTPGSGGTDAGSTYWFAKPNTDTVIIPLYCNWPIRFLGTGSSVLAVTFDGNTPGEYGNFFEVQTGGIPPGGSTKLGDNTGGMTFEDLYFTYPAFSGLEPYTAIYAVPAGVQNLRVIRCVFVDCPGGINIQQGLQSTITECTFHYHNNWGTSVTLGNNESSMEGSGFAKQVYMAGNLFYSDHSNKSAVQTALQVYGVEHLKMADSRIDSYNNGILITPGPGKNALRCSFTNVAVYVGTDELGNLGSPLTLAPSPGMGENPISISQISFTGCFFELGDTAAPAAGAPGITIEASGGLIDNVRFVSCFSTRWPGPGLSIDGNPTNVEIVGGFYSGNQYGMKGVSPWGIYVKEATGVRVVGVACIGQYEWVTDGKNKPSDQQDYGIYLDDGAEDVLISACDIRGNRLAGIYVNGGASEVLVDSCNLTDNTTNGVVIAATSTAVTNVSIRNCNVTSYSLYSDAIAVSTSGPNAHSVQVTDCAGYNDQAVGGAFSVPVNSAFHAYDRGYYGPATLYVPPSGLTSNIKVGATNTGLTSGSFVLAPGVAGEIIGFSGTITIVMVGQ